MRFHWLSRAAFALALALTLPALIASCGGTAVATTASPSPLVVSASPQPLAGFDLWAAGTRVFSSGDGGATWQAKHAPQDLYWNIAASDARHAWVARPSGGLLATSDGGAVWTVQRPDKRHGQLVSVACSDTRHLAVTGWSPQGAFILTTADGGLHWRSSPFLRAPHNLNAIARPDARQIWAVGSPGLPSEAPGGIVAGRDGGATWVVQMRDRNVHYRGVAFSDAHNGWAVGYENKVGGAAVVMRTGDGGATWTRLRLPEAAALFAVACSDPLHAWAVGKARDGSRAAIASTVDGGKTWSVRPVSLAGAASQRLSLMAVTCSDASHIWAAGTTQHAGVVLASSDGGATWTVQSTRADMATLRAVTWASGQ